VALTWNLHVAIVIYARATHGSLQLLIVVVWLSRLYCERKIGQIIANTDLVKFLLCMHL
jgi:hypothetical protein